MVSRIRGSWFRRYWGTGNGVHMFSLPDLGFILRNLLGDYRRLGKQTGHMVAQNSRQDIIWCNSPSCGGGKPHVDIIRDLVTKSLWYLVTCAYLVPFVYSKDFNSMRFNTEQSTSLIYAHMDTSCRNIFHSFWWLCPLTSVLCLLRMW